MLGILEVDLAEAPRAGNGAPEAVGGAPQQAATLAREGGEVLHGGDSGTRAPELGTSSGNYRAARPVRDTLMAD